MAKHRNWFKRTAVATTLLTFLTGAKMGAEEITFEKKTSGIKFI